MSDRRSPRGRAATDERGHARPGVALAVALVLVAGVAAWWQYARRPAPRATPPPPAEVVERALAQVEADSLALKTKWVDTVPGIDASGLEPSRHELFVRFINARFCECGCGYTLGACRNFDPTCPYSEPLVAALLDSIEAGHRFDLEGLRPRPEM